MNESQTEEILDNYIEEIKKLVRRVSKLEKEIEELKKLIPNKNTEEPKENKIEDRKYEEDSIIQETTITEKKEFVIITEIYKEIVGNKVSEEIDINDKEMQKIIIEGIKRKDGQILGLSGELKKEKDGNKKIITEIKKAVEGEEVSEKIDINNKEIEKIINDIKNKNFEILEQKKILTEKKDKLLNSKKFIAEIYKAVEGKENVSDIDINDEEMQKIIIEGIKDKNSKLSNLRNFIIEIEKVVEGEEVSEKININNTEIEKIIKSIKAKDSKISKQEDTIIEQNAELEKFSNFKKIEEIFSKYNSIPKEERKKYDSLLKPELGKDVFLFLAISKFENLKEFLQQDFLKNENFYPVLIDLYDYVFEIKNKEFDEEVYERIESEPGTKYNPITQIVSENGKSDGEIEKTIITGYQRKRDGKVLYKSIVLLK